MRDKMKKFKMIIVTVLALVLVFSIGGCSKKKDADKAAACDKSQAATADLDGCLACCKDAGYNGGNWTGKSCKCL
ncbi:MAG: hypothetical protein JRJ19_00490 [Deltaproteobacteria bacterium]|nr:hypothetical protein [Deltaproteobacteria bacterium]MBW1870509.1 hypothetical protein [Deltaproteobacteria bacterium]